MNISPKAKETTDRLNNFMDKHVYPNNETYHSQIENFGADRWQVVPVIEDLKKEAKKVECVWLATDPDREGEAIAWHVQEALGKTGVPFKRIVFNEITKSAVLSAIQEPREINHNLVNAQQARRILDRVVGYEMSPILWKKLKRGLSAGRVQSVAVRLIVEKNVKFKHLK